MNAESTSRQSSINAETENDRELRETCQRVLGGRRLTIASNRGPVTYEKDEAGQVVTKRGSGGVVTALTTLTDYTPITWVAAALSEDDRKIAQAVDHGEERPETEQNPQLRLRFVNINEDSFDKYLNVISNPLLWFVQHEMNDLLKEGGPNPQEITQAWREGYVTANRLFARAIIEEAGRPEASPYVILHDYQLYLAPSIVRQQRPDLHLLHFTHIPWPEPESWRQLPAGLVRTVCDALLECDIVGFQTSSAASAFARTCQEYLENVEVEETEQGNYRLVQTLTAHKKRLALVNAYPISIDPASVREAFQSQAAQDWVAKLTQQLEGSDRLIVRVDRLDPNKNIITGFEAYQKLLEEQPDLHGRLVFLALLVPTRESVTEYATYKDQTFQLIDEINRRFGRPGWQPIQHIYGNDYHRALAALSLADVVLVNSVADGMNLVAKEAMIINERGAVLVLSRQTGAWEEMGQEALGVEPDDVDGTARALLRALKMPDEARQHRADQLTQTVESGDLSTWLNSQLRDLGQLER